MLNYLIATIACIAMTLVLIWLGLVYSRNGLGPWVFLLGAFVILVAVLVSIGVRGPVRIYWIGFGVSALSYLGYSLQFERFGYSPPCAWALLCGWLGGHFTSLVAKRSRPEPVRES